MSDYWLVFYCLILYCFVFLVCFYVPCARKKRLEQGGVAISQGFFLPRRVSSRNVCTDVAKIGHQKALTPPCPLGVLVHLKRQEPHVERDPFTTATTHAAASHKI